MGEHQGEVGELTVVILVEEGHWVALSTVRVIGAEGRSHRQSSTGNGVARGRPRELREDAWEVWVLGIEEWW